MPVGMRGLIVAGVFATMMGSTSAALNALATSYTKDFYQPYVNPRATDVQAIRAARVATAVFGILMILVATMAAYLVLKDPKLTIIPIALGIFGYTYGALLGVFLVGMLTRTRGADKTNIIGMLLGVAAVLILCKIELPLFGATIKFGGFMPDWWPKIAWSWYVLVGCFVTFAFCVLFRTPQSQIDAAVAHVGSAPLPGK
jgi:Na+/proline symporter